MPLGYYFCFIVFCLTKRISLTYLSPAFSFVTGASLFFYGWGPRGGYSDLSAFTVLVEGADDLHISKEEKNLSVIPIMCIDKFDILSVHFFSFKFSNFL